MRSCVPPINEGSHSFTTRYLARSACLPGGLYVLLVLIVFLGSVTHF